MLACPHVSLLIHRIAGKEFALDSKYSILRNAMKRVMSIKKSIVQRYLILSVLAATLPELAIGLLYDRFTSNALEQLLGEKLSTHLTATANRLGAYVEARRYQLETLANYPGTVSYTHLDVYKRQFRRACQDQLSMFHRRWDSLVVPDEPYIARANMPSKA